MVRDIDLDGQPDIVLHRRDGALLYRRGLGGGAFGPATIFPLSIIDSAAALDIDQDGDIDLLASRGEWFENVDEFGTPVCRGEPNSVRPGAELFATGSLVIFVDQMTLNVRALPPSAFGSLLTSLQPSAPVRPPGSSGNLCLGGSIGRFDRPGEIRQADAGGILRLPVELGDVPDAALGSVAIVAPEARYFQLWYRDFSGGVSTSNFSSTLRVDLR